jgi:hypothetical protein
VRAPCCRMNSISAVVASILPGKARSRARFEATAAGTDDTNIIAATTVAPISTGRLPRIVGSAANSSRAMPVANAPAIAASNAAFTHTPSPADAKIATAPAIIR